MGASVGDRRVARDAVGELLRLLLQRPASARLVEPVGQKITVFGAADEQQPEQDRKRHFARTLEFGWARGLEIARRGDALGKHQYHLVVDALAQALGKAAREAVRLRQDLP